MFVNTMCYTSVITAPYLPHVLVNTRVIFSKACLISLLSVIFVNSMCYTPVITAPYLPQVLVDTRVIYSAELLYHRYPLCYHHVLYVSYNSRACLISLLSFMFVNPLSPHDALMHHFTSLKQTIFPTTKGFRTNISMKLIYQYMAIFFFFLNHIKSSSSTTSRELRQQFAACIG